MLGYLGKPIELSKLVEAPPHSLERQSYAAREMVSATVNADGWGAAWYLPGDPNPCLYRVVHPIWADVNRAHLGRTVRSSVLLAAVRSATDPLSLAPANTQPFAFESLSFVHNGFVQDFREHFMRPLRKALSETAYASIAGNTDSEHLFALAADAFIRKPELEIQERLILAAQSAATHVRALAEASNRRALLTFLIAAPQALVAVRSSIGQAPPSLYFRREPEAVVFASEPLDSDAAWTALPEHSGMFVDLSGKCEPFELAPSVAAGTPKQRAAGA